MLSSEVELVDSAWGNIGMSRPEYLAWKRIKKFLAEVQSSSHSGESAPCEEELCPECKGSNMSNKCSNCGMWF